MDFAACLAAVPPQVPIQVDLADLQLWKKAIAKLKAHSARRADLVSAQELKMLPDHAISALARILASDPDGFPDTFMWGITCPLSKSDGLPTAGQSRPITVLPQLYRLWAAVICQQVAQTLAFWMPCDITGFLPSRGAADQLSVIVMLAISAVKCYFVRPAHTQEFLRLSAYADNWSWTTDTSPLHCPLLTRTKTVTDMEISALECLETMTHV